MVSWACGGAVASWLCSTLDRGVWVGALVGDIVFCCVANSHHAFLHPSVHMGTSKFNAMCDTVVD